ncbi:hypothetical protein GOV04_02025 [Candidatus Woesearchaeota archaeon]|nr:hypothetical protein [Candidatus Woesearchaeota archaeon]
MTALKIIGTSHISRESINEIKNAFNSFEPTILALELDVNRAQALLSKQKSSGFGFRAIKQVGLQGYLFGVIASWVQRRLAKKTGLNPGDEMKQALLLARKNKLKVFFIDRDIAITLRRLSQSITWREKLRVFKDLFFGVFTIKKQLRAAGVETLDLSKVPPKTVIKKLMLALKSKYPTIYKVLVYERDHIMANNLEKIIQEFGDDKILAVMGAGHEDSVKKLLEKYL